MFITFLDIHWSVYFPCFRIQIIIIRNGIINLILTINNKRLKHYKNCEHLVPSVTPSGFGS